MGYKRYIIYKRIDDAVLGSHIVADNPGDRPSPSSLVNGDTCLIRNTNELYFVDASLQWVICQNNQFYLNNIGLESSRLNLEATYLKEVPYYDGTAASDQSVLGNDSRLSNARSPTAHKASHEPGGSDVVTGLATAGEKAALAGTSGAPSAANKYITDADARNINTRPVRVSKNGADVGTRAKIDFDGRFLLTDNPGQDRVEIVPFTATPSGLANTNIEGTGGALAKDSHQHKRDVRVAKAGVDVGTRNRLNLIEGANITLTVADDGAQDEVDVTIAAGGGTAESHISLLSVFTEVTF